MVTLTPQTFEVWNTGVIPDQGIAMHLETLIAPHLSAPTFPHLDAEVKQQFANFSIQKYQVAPPELQLAILRTFKVLFREKENLDALVTPNFAQFIVEAAALIEASQNVDNFEVIMEACRVLVNALYQSEAVRNGFIVHNCAYVNHLAERIFTTSLQIFNPGVQQPIFSDFTPEKLLELLYLDLRVSFVITALAKAAQVQLAEHTRVFVGLIRAFLDRLIKSETPVEATNRNVECTTEALKVLFNVYCHSTDPEPAAAKACANQCSLIVRSARLPVGLKQDAVNVLATICPFVHELCPATVVLDDASGSTSIVYEGHDVTFVDALLKLLDERMETFGTGPDVELLGTFFTVLLQLCRDVKAVRRYCRMRILPPLRAADVERPPDAGDTTRNRMIRLMSQGVGECRKIVAEFIFVLCKRSVPRMVKYCGFGHAAGLLADYGFLGRLGDTRRGSDSDDSETEDYRQVAPDVNAVSGYIQPPIRNPFEGMSDEQKEHEAMKLANTMDKLLESGVFAPGRIGADGRPQAVQHVAELVKDVDVEMSGDESD
ncbi:Synembryn [Aphelenchoides fujianensis]|nr:Synembryn [Aphelenchoides fujianensis]